MICSFKNKETESIFDGSYSRIMPRTIQKVAMRKLWMIDAVVQLKDLKIPPANRLEKLKGHRKNQYSIRINKQWRVCFNWKQSYAYDVEIVDYH